MLDKNSNTVGLRDKIVFLIENKTLHYQSYHYGSFKHFVDVKQFNINFNKKNMI